MKKDTQNRVEYFEDREREIEHKELNVRTRAMVRDLNENLFVEGTCN